MQYPSTASLKGLRLKRPCRNQHEQPEQLQTAPASKPHRRPTTVPFISPMEALLPSVTQELALDLHKRHHTSNPTKTLSVFTSNMSNVCLTQPAHQTASTNSSVVVRLSQPGNQGTAQATAKAGVQSSKHSWRSSTQTFLQGPPHTPCRCADTQLHIQHTQHVQQEAVTQSTAHHCPSTQAQTLKSCRVHTNSAGVSIAGPQHAIALNHTQSLMHDAWGT
jgi:hypothetical protein